MADINQEAKRRQATEHLRNNRLREAGNLFREITETSQDDADAWFMLGAVYGQLGDYFNAERCARKVVSLQPDAFAAWDNLGISLMLQGNLQEAESCFRKALAINPGHAPGLNNLGNVLSAQHKPDAALACFHKAIECNPTYAEAHNNRGITLRVLGRHSDAEQSFRRALQINPGYADAQHNLGDSLAFRGDLAGALANYERALQLQPLSPETHFALGTVMEGLNRKNEALAHYAQALKINPAFTKAIVNSAGLLATQGQPDVARERLEQGLKTSPQNPDILAGLANIASIEGRYQDAYDMLKPAIESGTANLKIALAYAPISHHAGSPSEARSLIEKLIDKSTLPATAIEEARLALGKLAESLGDFSGAFEQYRKANTIVTRETDLPDHLHEFESMERFFTPERLATLPGSTNRSGLPVFIVGMPRSGTSLVEQILSSHPLVHGGGELTELWTITQSLAGLTGNIAQYPECLCLLEQADLDRCAGQYTDFLAAMDKTAKRVTDKLPHNFIHLGLVQLMLPSARVIHCIRDARDTCLSIYSHKFNINHRYAHSLADLGHYYRGYERLMKHWRAVLEIPLIEVEYEQLVLNPDREIRKLVSFCELPWSDQCLDYHESGRRVYTPSRDQVRRPLYTSAIGRWQRFGEKLAPLLEALEQEQS